MNPLLLLALLGGGLFLAKSSSAAAPPKKPLPPPPPKPNNMTIQQYNEIVKNVEAGITTMEKAAELLGTTATQEEIDYDNAQKNGTGNYELNLKIDTNDGFETSVSDSKSYEDSTFGTQDA